MKNSSSFTPPFCPNRKCNLHDPNLASSHKGHSKPWYHSRGRRRLTSGKPVFLFRCKYCGKYFCSRTFSVDYWEKRHLSLPRLVKMLTSCMSLRAIARAMHCSPKTVDNKICRLTRQAVTINAILRKTINLSEDLAADGFESFTGSQYFPNNYHILVGKRSQFVYFVNYAQLRRKGRMTEKQKRNAFKLRQEVPIPPFEVRNRFAELIDELSDLQLSSTKKKHLMIYTDEKPEYAPLIERMKYGGVNPSLGYRITHHVTNSKEPRTVSNALFPVNYIDREFRKDLSEHVRETSRFGRNVNAAVGRMELYLFHHNFIKPFRVEKRKRSWETHAMAAGFPPDTVARLLRRWTTRRIFASHAEMNMHQRKVLIRRYDTPWKEEIDSFPAYVYA